MFGNVSLKCFCGMLRIQDGVLLSDVEHGVRSDRYLTGYNVKVLAEAVINQHERICQLEKAVSELSQQVAQLRTEHATHKLSTFVGNCMTYFMGKVADDFDCNAQDAESLFIAKQPELRFERVTLRKANPGMPHSDYVKHLYAMPHHQRLGESIAKAGFTFEEYELMIAFCEGSNCRSHLHLAQDGGAQQVVDCIALWHSSELPVELVSFQNIAIKAVEMYLMATEQQTKRSPRSPQPGH